MTGSAPQVIVIAGPNGAGKSTLAPFLLRDTLGLVEYVNADTIAQGLAAFDPESVAFEAGRIMLGRLHSLGRQRKSFAFESTLATRSYARWLSRLKADGYRIHILFLWLRSADLAVERVRLRVTLGGHNIPEQVIRRRYLRGVTNFLGVYRHLANTWSVMNNSESDRLSAIALGSAEGTISVQDERIWNELNEIAG